ncbi:MAG: hypothetical protein BMS9Abin06_1157 [Gammaproteobacteria bacterium]|nr:MAG: hypothetical protein BMS9Abin06_1157 [Gammaproteobacteria bacterium]
MITIQQEPVGCREIRCPLPGALDDQAWLLPGRLSAIPVPAPPSPGNLTAVINRCVRSFSRYFMAEHGGLAFNNKTAWIPVF